MDLTAQFSSVSGCFSPFLVAELTFTSHSQAAYRQVSQLRHDAGNLKRQLHSESKDGAYHIFEAYVWGLCKGISQQNMAWYIWY